MDQLCNGLGSDPTAGDIFEVAGEPAIVINGVPKLSAASGISDNHKAGASEDAEKYYDPMFGDWLVGRKVKKMFGSEYYTGEVVEYYSRENWYRVAYEDGDVEDLEWHELEGVLLPLDISIPLASLALRRTQQHGVFLSSSGKDATRSRSHHGRDKDGGKNIETHKRCLTGGHKGEATCDSGDQFVEGLRTEHEASAAELR